jgi:hypothetical protein
VRSRNDRIEHPQRDQPEQPRSWTPAPPLDYPRHRGQLLHVTTLGDLECECERIAAVYQTVPDLQIAHVGGLWRATVSGLHRRLTCEASDRRMVRAVRAALLAFETKLGKEMDR